MDNDNRCVWCGKDDAQPQGKHLMPFCGPACVDAYWQAVLEEDGDRYCPDCAAPLFDLSRDECACKCELGAQDCDHDY